jgi:AmmeMemoRadiSam system protein B
MRNPAVAGAFYDADPAELRESIRRCFLSERGPGQLPDESNRGSSRKIRGLVVPHAGYMYSGEIAAHAYLELWKDGLPETIVVIGPNHYSGWPAVALSEENYLTPLGEVEVDRHTSKMLEGGAVHFDDLAQVSEHSIEVQLPFLQFLSHDFEFVPICMGAQDADTAISLGSRIADVLVKKDAVIIASSDFSHYVPPASAHMKDMRAIKSILGLDAVRFLRTVSDERISMCGYGPVATMLSAVNGTVGTLLSYGHSGQVRAMKDVVGYGAIKIE